MCPTSIPLVYADTQHDATRRRRVRPVPKPASTRRSTR
jgi:hypothetical protein